jgi:serine/threonine protein kinase/tetratricopeptide (TPR) repeat protein
MDNLSAVESVFFAALDRETPEERAAYLDQACGADPELRRCVERLLQAQPRVGSFLQSPAPVPTVDIQPVAERPGTVLGPYKLLEQIGEGGFGVVFMAEQEQPVRRKVALKVLKAGMDSRQVVARFEAERQALALMDHPNIARVFDGGETVGGRPYFVMELVRGLPITAYCDQVQATPRQRLELFISVCQAVQHAHQKGIIHRDLKPSNVLVTLQDGAALVKVIDFGIAKAMGQQLTDKTVFTGFAQMIGTPLYMSPEQAALSNVDVDTRSDVYALGVLLYELLTGTTPFGKERLQEVGFDELRRIIREEEPPRPSTRISTLGQAATTVSAQRKSDPKRLSQLMRGELDWIVMKALDKDRNRRYETASAFAADVQRYLHDDPVQACPPSAGYRLRKFVRRNRGPVAAGALVFLALLAGIIGTTWGLVWAEEAIDAEAAQRTLAENAQKEEAKQRALAVANAQKALQEKAAAEAARDRAAKARDKTRLVLEQMLSEITQESLQTQIELTPQQKKFLTEVLQYYREFAAEKAEDDLELYERITDAADRVGLIEYRLGRLPEAAAAWGQARDELTRLAFKYPDNPAIRSNLAGDHNDLGVVLMGLGRYSEALQSFQAARKLWGDLAKEFKGERKYRKRLATVCDNLGTLLARMEKDAEALAAYREANGLLEQLVKESKEPEYLHLLANNLTNLALEYKHLGQPKKELENYQAALKLQEELLQGDRDNPLYRDHCASTHMNLGTLHHKTGQWTAARQSFGTALEMAEKLVAEYPGAPRYRFLLTLVHLNQGLLFGELGQRKEAGESFGMALAISARLATDFPKVPKYRRAVAKSHTGLGLLLHFEKPEEALKSYRAGLALNEILAAEVGAEPVYLHELAANQNDLAQVLAVLGKRTEATQTLQEAVALRRRLVKAFPTSRLYRQLLAQCLNNLGNRFKDLGERTEALETYQEALQVQKDLVRDFGDVPDCRKELAARHHALGELLWDLGQWPEALKEYQETLNIQNGLAETFTDEPDYRKQLARDYLYLSGKLREVGRLKDALDANQTAMGLCLALVGKFEKVTEYRKVLADCYNDLGILHSEQGKSKEAQVAFQAAQEHIERLAREFPAMPAYQQKLAQIHYNQGYTFWLRSRWPEAQAAFQVAIPVQEKLTADYPKVATYRGDLATSYNDLGWALNGLGKRPEALVYLHKALSIREQLAAEIPGDPHVHINLAGTYCNIGHVLRDAGKAAESLDWYARAIDCLQPLLKDKGKWMERATLFAHNTHLGRAWALDQLKRPAEALEAHRAALAARVKLATEFPGVVEHQRDLAQTFNDLGQRLLKDPKQRAEALASFRAALKVQEDLVKALPTVAAAYRENLANNYSHLGILLTESGQWSEAADAHKAELTHREKLAKDFPDVPDHKLHLGGCCINLGNALSDGGKPAESLDLYARAIATLDPLLVEGKPWFITAKFFMGNAHSGRALALKRLNRQAEAVDAYRTAAAHRKKLVDDLPEVAKYRENLAYTYNGLGVLLRRLGKFSEAADVHQAELPHRERLAKDFPDAPGQLLNLAGCYSNLGSVIKDGGKPLESLDWFARAIARLDPLLDEKKPWYAAAKLFKRNAHLGRADALVKLDRHAEALADWDQTVDLSDPKQRPEMQAYRALSRLRAGKAEDAVAEVAELTKLNIWNGAGLYNFACIYAVASAKDKARQEEHAQRAVALLRQAVKAGFTDVALMKKDTDLDPLRQRDDFKKLLAELDKSR